MSTKKLKKLEKKLEKLSTKKTLNEDERRKIQSKIWKLNNSIEDIKQPIKKYRVSPYVGPLVVEARTELGAVNSFIAELAYTGEHSWEHVDGPWEGELSSDLINLFSVTEVEE